jgi:tricorn protease
MKPNKLVFSFLLIISFFITDLDSQVDARMFRNPDVSDSHICFTYANDIWVVPKKGGVASKLSSPEGVELFAKFSPDGKQIAFSGNYQGYQNVYVVPSSGGIPKRLTTHDSPEQVLDWHPDGSKVLFASARESGRQRFRQLYTVPSNGGPTEKLPVAYGEIATFHPDGNAIYYSPRTRVFRNWKRYRGGSAPDIWSFNLSTLASENLTQNIANDEFPMATSGALYFISDRGTNSRYNIWKKDLKSGKSRQVTRFSDYDIHFPSIGGDEIVFEAGGKIYLLNTVSDKYHEVKINLVSDRMKLQPTIEKGERYISGVSMSPDGNRVLVEARGDLFSVPAEKGYVKTLSSSSSSADRYPSWSPDGKSVAFWNDRSGEYDLYIKNIKSGKEEKILSAGEGYRYNLHWSPDSEKILFMDQEGFIKYLINETGELVDVDKDQWMTHGGQQNFRVSWSHDSKWITYSLGGDNRSQSIYVFDTNSKKKAKLTSGFYNDFNPVFDTDGKYIYFYTNRNFSPSYSDFDNSWVYSNSTQIALITLRKDIKSPMAPKNDEVTIKEEKKESEKEDEKEASEKEESKTDEVAKDEEKKEEENKNEDKGFEIDFDNIERRTIILPVNAGNFARLFATKGKIIYNKLPYTGSPSGGRSAVAYFDLEKQEEKEVLGAASALQITSDGKKLLVRSGRKMGIISVAPGQKLSKTLPISDIEVHVNPAEEWMQMFNDVWRFERDFFYDKTMHGVDWNEMKTRYGKLVKFAETREDLNFIIGDLIAELNASHTYNGGGDVETASNRNIGYLGIDWTTENGKYKIYKIIRGASWDAKSKSPLDEPGVDVAEGSYIFSVNGKSISAEKDFYYAFDGLAGKTVELVVGIDPNIDSAKTVIVKLMSSETRLRHLAWIETNRMRVDRASDGKIGYIYVRSTGVDGQNELVRQFAGQWNKEGLIIDERFNSGGQIPDRFIELLDRKPLAYWAVRNKKEWQWPPIAHFGPKAMLINGWSGSGGDAFPDYFRKAGLGPLIGARTWGGLIGISGAPALVDGGGATVPTFRMYNPDGSWFKEGHGVDPDIVVKEDPTSLANGIDTQLEKAIEVVKKQLETEKKSAKKPKKENRV